VWLYGDQVLDYVVERKKADDLVSSIFDGRYKDQKYRLRNSGFGNVYYLYEGHLTGQNAKSEREAASALLRTRVKDEFRVVRVKSITESVKFLSFLT
jgi:crossover junction endonuclease MUS81